MKITTAHKRQLTSLLRKAEKTDWWGDDLHLCTFGFAAQWPGHIDWGMTGQEARALYDEINALRDEMLWNGERLTPYQRKVFSL